ncbi:MAG: D-alanyl-D-alanine carboxypeptidase [Lachnospiraceae bacterium]|nr:D-alanyl-D-alanine carboxypeptidase [Lachnospiraceae bacterium]
MSHTFLRKFGTISLCMAICLSAFWNHTALVYADVDYAAEAEERKSLPIQTNEIENWPQGPQIGAEGAILMEVNTGTILYAKNIDEKLYPASTTKILTALVAIENAELNEDVSFSYEAVFGIERGSSNMGMNVGEVITMEQCLYGILVYSANEVCNAIGEHIAGSIDGYVDMMNAKAAELGCTNSHFVTTNGLHDENHYTTPRDLATIACAFFSNQTLSKMANTAYYHIPPSPTQPDANKDLWTHNSLTKGTYTYDGYIGGKTGYTSDSRQTLVSCAERDGMKLVCVIMKEESPNQFLDTIALFDYGFNNFQKINISENETNYTINDADLFQTENDILFSSDPIIEINTQDCVIIPNTVTFQDLTSTLNYETADAEENGSLLATIRYQYHGQDVGSASISLTSGSVPAIADSAAEMDSASLQDDKSDINLPSRSGNIIFINVLKVIGIILLILALIIISIIIVAFCRNYNFARRRRSRLSRKLRRRNRTPRNRRRN